MKKVKTMSQLERLRQDIAQNESAVESAVTLINGFISRLREALAGTSVESQVKELADELEASSVKLATAVAEGSAAAEDSDTFYDPAPVGENHQPEVEAGAAEDSLGSAGPGPETAGEDDGSAAVTGAEESE